MKLTKVTKEELTASELDLLRKAVVFSSTAAFDWTVAGNGRVVGDRSIIRSLIEKGLAFRDPRSDNEYRAYLTRAAFALFELPLPYGLERWGHPFDRKSKKAWP